MLNPGERKALKARAHKLEPVVRIGARGLTDDIIAEIERALKAHELIKVRAGELDRRARDAVYGSICEKTGADAVQQVGKVFVLFRKNP